ncbi:MAG: aspartate aminotransferase family protein [Bacteroidetes bacterium]|nr:aspartate aminotransferase family protein [Bacteroidota bacterium]MBS1933347.1 aspartate aminotransferase family protein [Bacteroidota bacterium]
MYTGSILEGDSNLSEARKKWAAAANDPETKATLTSDATHFLHQALSTPCLDVLEECEGIYIINQQGKKYMDFHGNAVHQVGYRNPFVIEKVKEQLDIMPFSPRRFTNVKSIELARKLTSLLPSPLNRVLFAPGGTSAISMALKLARLVTGKFKTVSYWDSFHGASMDAISAGGEREFRAGLGPLIPGCERIPPPNSYRGSFSGISNDLVYAEYLEYVVEKEGDIGAFIAEPIRNTDVQVPSKAYWKRIREICDKNNIVLIFDEIPTAFGRTGKMFAFENFGIQPDIICLGKGLGGGIMPLAAIVANESYNRFGDVSLGHFTHEKSPLAAVAALAMIEFIESHQLLEKTNQKGEWMKKRLHAMKEKYPLIGDIRGVGLLWGVELVTDPGAKTKANKQAEAVLYDCLQNGMSFKISQGNTLQLAPPLIITEEQLAEAMNILEKAISKVS